MALSEDPILVHVTRGALVESVHSGAVAICDGGGAVRLAVGDVNRPVYPRSAIKALQAIPLVESGAAADYDFDDRELAVICASHGGEPDHVATVRGILDKIGLGEEALACGAHWPLGQAEAYALSARGGRPTAIHNNCSGKHAGMLALAVHSGLDVAGYEQKAHPVQQRIASTMAALTGAALRDDHCAIDGCSVPTWGLPLAALGRAMARFATGDELGDARSEACRRLRRACMSAPWYVAGTGRFCTDVMRALDGQAFLKEGAEGVYCAALPAHGIGIALKVSDGAKRAAECMMRQILLHLLPDQADTVRKVTNTNLANWRGRQVGHVEASAEFVEMLAAATGSWDG